MSLALKAAPRVGNACCKLEASAMRPSTPPIIEACMDCTSKRNNFIPPKELADKLSQTVSEPLILDIRPFIAFNSTHIIGAINISCCDRFTKRRLQNGKVSVLDLLNKCKTKEDFKARTFSNDVEVIVYDEGSVLGDLNGSHPLTLVVESLFKEGKEAQILQGGLKEFQAHYSQLCEKPNEGDGHCPLYSPTTPCIEPAIDTAIASEILPFLYIGNERDAANRERLDALGITHVLNVTSKLPCHFKGQGIEYCQLQASDSGYQNLKQYFAPAAKFIEEARSNGGKVLVHCQAGVSRSPTITVAYIMRRTQMGMADAYKYVKHLRSIVSPNFNFLGQLLEFEKALENGDVERELDPKLPIESEV